MAKATIALTFPECVNRGDGPCEAWQHLAGVYKQNIAEHNGLRKSNWEQADEIERLQAEIRALEQKRLELNVTIGERDAEIERLQEALEKLINTPALPHAIAAAQAEAKRALSTGESGEPQTMAGGIKRLEGELRKAPGDLKSYGELLLESERLSTKGR